MSTEVLEQKKPHPLSKEAKEARALEQKQETPKQQKEVEVEREKTFEELYNLPEVDSTKTYQFEYVIQRENPSPNLGISNRCEIFDPIQKRIRVIRYSPHEESLFEEDQHELPGGGYHVDSVPFPYGICHVDGKKKNLVHFMRLHNDNVANCQLPTRNPKFKGVDKEADAKKLLEANSIREKATTLAATCDVTEMLPYAKILGINIKDRSESEIRYDFVRKATANPSEFIKGVGNPVNKRLYVVMKGFEQNILTDLHIKNQIHWRGSKVMICEVPAGEMSADYLTNWTFNSAEGETVYNQLVKQVV